MIPSSKRTLDAIRDIVARHASRGVVDLVAMMAEIDALPATPPSAAETADAHRALYVAIGQQEESER